MKFQCDCGARFSFEIAPGGAPVQFNCPECGVDSSALVNRLIKEEHGLTVPMAAPVAQAALEPPRARPVHGQSRACPRHPDELVAERCRVCGKPICPECMALFGYVCSAYCRQRAADAGMEVPVFADQRDQIEARARSKSRRFWLSMAAAFLALLAVAMWFWLVGSKPRVAYAVRFDSPRAKGQARLLGPGQALLFREGKLIRYNSGGGLDWSVNWAQHEPEDSLGRWVNSKGTVWLSEGRRLGQFDLSDGQLKRTIDAGGQVLRMAGGAEGMMAEAKTLLGNYLVWRVSAERAEEKTLELPREAEMAEVALGSSSAVVLSARLLRTDQIAPPERKENQTSVLDGPVTAGNSMALAGDMVREIQRDQMGEAVEGVGVYLVNLKWVFGGDKQEWSGELAGDPQLRSQSSVETLVASTNLLVFSHAGRLLWRKTLANSVCDLSARSGVLANDVQGCCLEDKGVLYVWDCGMLSAFEALGGQVYWRLPQPGVLSIALDDTEGVYVNALERIQTPMSQVTRQVILKVGARSGKVLWRRTNVGHVAGASGKFLYSAEWASGPDRVKPRPGFIPAHVRIYRLNTGDGSICWEYYDNREPVMIDMARNTILLLFKDEMQVLKFMTL